MVEDQLPGMVKMMEERFGRFGRLMTTVLLLAVWVAVVAWALKMGWDNLLVPLTRAIDIIPGLPKYELGFVSGLVGSSLLFFLAYASLQGYMARRRRALLREEMESMLKQHGLWKEPED